MRTPRLLAMSFVCGYTTPLKMDGVTEIEAGASTISTVSKADIRGNQAHEPHPAFFLLPDRSIFTREVA